MPYNPYALQTAAYQSPLYGLQQGNPYGGYQIGPAPVSYAGDPSSMYAAMASVMNNQNTNQTQYETAWGNANVQRELQNQQLRFNEGQTIYRTGYEDQWNQRQNDTQRYGYDQQLAGQLGVAGINGQTQLGTAQLGLQGQLGSALMGMQGQLGSAQIGADASRYGNQLAQQTALAGYQNQMGMAQLQNTGDTTRAQIAADASTVPAYLRQDRFNQVLPMFSGILGGLGFGGGSSSPTPSPSPPPQFPQNPTAPDPTPVQPQLPFQPQATNPNQIVAGPPGRAPMTAYESALTNNRQALLDLNRFRQHDPNIFGTEANIGRQQNAQVVNAQRGPNAPPALSTMGQRPSAPFVQSQRSANPAVANSSFRVGQSPPSLAATRFPGTVPEGQYPGVGVTGRSGDANMATGGGSPNTAMAYLNGPGSAGVQSAYGSVQGNTPSMRSQLIDPTGGSTGVYNQNAYSRPTGVPGSGAMMQGPSSPGVQNAVNNYMQGGSGMNRAQLIDPATGTRQYQQSNEPSADVMNANVAAYNQWVNTPIPQAVPTTPQAPTPQPYPTGTSAIGSPTSNMNTGIGATTNNPPSLGGGSNPFLQLIQGMPRGPLVNAQQQQQMLNSALAGNAASASQQRNAAQGSMASRGWSPSSPALGRQNNLIDYQRMNADTQARTQIPLQVAQANGQYGLQSAQAAQQAQNQYLGALSGYYGAQSGFLSPILSALAGFAG